MANEIFDPLEKQYGIPAGTLDKMWLAESSRGVNMQSPAGAQGHFGLMPGTAAELGVRDPNNLAESADGAARYLSQQLQRSGGDLPSALAAYNWGPGNLQRQGLDRAPKETRDYIQKVAGNMAEQDDPWAALRSQFSQGAAPAQKQDDPWEALRTQFTQQAPQQAAPTPAAQPAQVSEPVAEPVAEPPAPTTEMRRPDGTLVLNMSHQDAAPPSEQAAPQPPAQRSTMDSIGRQIGLTGRAALTGLTGLSGMVADVPFQAANAMGANMQLPSQAQQALLTRMGLPEPENSTERVAQGIAGAMSGTGATSTIGNGMAQLPSMAAQGVGGLLAGSPVSQVISTVGGSGAAGLAREAGVGPMGQLGAGLLGGTTPGLLSSAAAGTARGVLRGGEQGRQNMLQNIDLFNRVGTSPTIGQASQGRFAQGIESALSRAPGGAGIMNNKAVTQASQVGQTVDDLVGRLTPRAGAVEAGESISSGLDSFKQGVKSMQGRLYDRLDSFLPAQSPIGVGRTRDALAALNADIKQAPALGKMFQNSRIQGIERALTSDIDATPNVMGSVGGERSTASLTLPYTSIKKLRTLVGKEIDNANFTSDVPRDKWRALYGALSDDLGDAATAAGPKAQKAWENANRYTREQMAKLEALDSVAGKDTPERVFQAALAGSKDGDTIVRRVVNAIPAENRRDLAGAVIKRMGRATSGNQNDTGDVFSTSTFLTNWNNLSPSARSTLFGRTGDSGVLDELSRLAGVASNVKEGSKVFANPSGTSGASALQALLVGGASSLASGNIPAAAAMGAVPVAANMGARFMTSPDALQWLAKKTPAPYPLIPGLLNSAATIR